MHTSCVIWKCNCNQLVVVLRAFFSKQHLLHPTVAAAESKSCRLIPARSFHYFIKERCRHHVYNMSVRVILFIAFYISIACFEFFGNIEKLMRKE